MEGTEIIPDIDDCIPYNINNDINSLLDDNTKKNVTLNDITKQLNDLQDSLINSMESTVNNSNEKNSIDDTRQGESMDYDYLSTADKTVDDSQKEKNNQENVSKEITEKNTEDDSRKHVEDKVDDVESKSDSTENIIDKSQNKTDVESKTDDIESKTDETENKMTDTESKKDDKVNKTTDTESKTDSTENKTEDNEKEINEAENKTNDIQNKTDDKENKISDTENKSDETNNKSDETENKPDETKNNLEKTENNPDQTEKEKDEIDNKSQDTENKIGDSDIKEDEKMEVDEEIETVENKVEDDENKPSDTKIKSTDIENKSSDTEKKSTDSEKKSVDSENTPIEKESKDAEKTSSDSERISSDSNKTDSEKKCDSGKKSESVKQSTDSEKKSSESEKKSSESEKKSDSEKKSSDIESKSVDSSSRSKERTDSPEPMETNDIETLTLLEDEKMEVDNKTRSEGTSSETSDKPAISLDPDDSSQNAMDVPSDKDTKTDDPEPGPSNSEKDTSNPDDASMEENPMFVTVSSKETEEEKDQDSQTQDETDALNLTEEDPIGIVQMLVEKEDESIEDLDDLVQGKGADKELCIIPDTEREISQEEKDAASAVTKPPEKLPKADDNKTTQENGSGNDTEAKSNNTGDLSKQGKISVVNHVSVASKTEEMKVIAVTDLDLDEIECAQCKISQKCRFRVEYQGKTLPICNDTCIINYRMMNKPKAGDESKSVPEKEATQEEIDKNKLFVRKCAECLTLLTGAEDKILTWETMEFCNEDCLSKHQTKIGSHCANCSKKVQMSSLGKYCVRFGHDIRQFCCSLCLEEFKKGLKVCSYCQKDISRGAEGFLAPVGDKGQFKDFCSQLCMENFDVMSNKSSTKSTSVEVGLCSVCKNTKQLSIIYERLGNKQKLCSEPCFVAFKFVNNADPLQCDMCKKYFETVNSTEFSIYSEAGVKNFCCKTCQNIHIIANRRIVPCSWCKVKKYNFDMIKKTHANGQVVNMCSLNCLNLFQVPINTANSKNHYPLNMRVKCDYCKKVMKSQYHMTLSDQTIRNFCTYQCIVAFQSQYPPPVQIAYNQERPTPAGPQTRRSHSTRMTRSTTLEQQEIQMPVITNVQSLAHPRGRSPEKSLQTTSSQTPVQAPLTQVKQQVIVQHPPPPAMKNKSICVRPITKNQSTECSVKVVNKETQTDPQKEKVRLVPIPVPVYVPSPMHMFSRPLPVPIPFPLPIPVPIFIPTTRNTAAGIMKEIKKIQVKIPTDPFEAELLRMAEMVAGEKKIDHTDSESEDDDQGGESFSPEAVDTSNAFGEDMLQMALKMATELDEPAVDLEGALTANTITATQSADNSGGSEEAVDDPQPIHPQNMLERAHIMRGRKRQIRQGRGGSMTPSKRGRRMSSNVDMPMLPPPQPTAPPEPVEKPDAHMCLKYTFGVNAWKQWVTTKNAELEKSSRRIKLFKNEILQLTADELNYSLCLFVKEVRKPNGTEYAPDTIYYLCLGIQQYLFENGRIDNIFTDAYYEKFTDCLDEVAKKFSVLYNDSYYIVTRVEEEHLWESKQLGAHSPHVLLSTLMFFNTKHFNLTTVEEHMQLSFSHIMKHWKRNPNQPGANKVPGSRNVLLRFYPPQTSLVSDSNSRKKKVYEQQENEENPLRCPVKLYEFYLSKCPESVKTRNDVFYLLPERSCVPDSPVWYSTMPLGKEALEKMLHRVKMVKEINVALLTS